MDLPLEQCLREIIGMTEDIRRRSLGVFDRSNQIVDVLPRKLDVMFPEDAHKRVNGRLFVCMTRLKDLKCVVVNEFESKKDLIDVSVQAGCRSTGDRRHHLLIGGSFVCATAARAPSPSLAQSLSTTNDVQANPSTRVRPSTAAASSRSGAETMSPPSGASSTSTAASPTTCPSSTSTPSGSAASPEPATSRPPTAPRSISSRARSTGCPST